MHYTITGEIIDHTVGTPSSSFVTEAGMRLVSRCCCEPRLKHLTDGVDDTGAFVPQQEASPDESSDEDGLLQRDPGITYIIVMIAQ